MALRFQRPKTKKEWAGFLHDSVKVAGRIGALVVHLRDQPKWYDYLSLLSVGSQECFRIYEEYFQNNSDIWNHLALSYRQLPHHISQISWPLLAHKRQHDFKGSGDLLLWEGQIEDFSLLWSARTAEEKPSRLYLVGDYDGFLEAISRQIWDALGFRHALVEGGSKVDRDCFPLDEHITTQFESDLHARLREYRKYDQRVGFLLEGPPGTGKTTAVQSIVRKESFTSLRIDLGMFTTTDLPFSEYTPSSIDYVRILRPDVIMIDDIDRLSKDEQPQLLSLLEIARKYARFVFVTSNNKERLLRPILRPGRLDDKIECEGVDERVLLKILGEEERVLFDRMKTWPIVYILTYKTRKEVFGREKALAELDELEERMRYVREEPV